MKGVSLQSDSKSKIILSNDFCERETVFAAALKFTEKYFVNIQPYDEHNTEVTMEPINKDVADDYYIKIF
ncbi:MAG: hypothetical protein LBT81_01715 [Helicobacteraceae bacterium]|jgi:hypothetical protein|nr:hypothetical protein [Helicobacteraceae bacterium]